MEVVLSQPFISVMPHPASSAFTPSRGRLHPEPAAPSRSEFQRDRDRILHSSAFRRLAHKTQVFIDPEGDHVRTRLTHTIEVAQIARSLARQLGLDEDLAEAIALAHDLGHPPFGHVGEDALDEALHAHGGFDHNAQAVAIVERLERRYRDYDGLNLSYETLEGIVAHNGPLLLPDGRRAGKDADCPFPEEIRRAAAKRGMDLTLHASAEAQCAAIADDIAYDAHDIEDAIRSDMLSIDDLASAPLVGPIVRQYRLDEIPERERAAHEAIRRLMALLVEDVVTVSRAALAGMGSSDEVRRCGRTLIAFSPAIAREEKGLKRFMFDNVYRSPKLAGDRAAATVLVKDLCQALMERPEMLPERWTSDASLGDDAIAEVVRDYVAGMTDRFAAKEMRRLAQASPAP